MTLKKTSRSMAAASGSRTGAGGLSVPFAAPSPALPDALDPAVSGRLARALLEWFAANQRDLPWRRSYDPYQIWIAEMMLQQTQMDRGTAYFVRWMERFPSLSHVAAASLEEVLHYWEGLGYYRRAVQVHRAAAVIMRDLGGRIPDDPEELKKLPGIGGYTANAIAAIAYRKDCVVLDANVGRIFARIFDIAVPLSRAEAKRFMEGAALAMLPPGTARSFNQALMELGEVVCRKDPRCAACPAAFCCRALRAGTAALRPAAVEKPAVIPVSSAHGILLAGGRVLVSRRPEGGLWAHMWEFPGCICTGPDRKRELAAAFASLGLEVRILQALGSVSHGYTNHRLSASFYRAAAQEDAVRELCSASPVLQLVEARDIAALPMPAHHRRMAERFFPAGSCRPTLI